MKLRQLSAARCINASICWLTAGALSVLELCPAPGTHTRGSPSPFAHALLYRRVEAETMAFSQGIKSEPNAKTGIYISEIHTGDYIKVREADFGSQSPAKFKASAASALRGGTLEVRADSIGGKVIAEIAVPHTGGWECWQTLETGIKTPITGVHDIYFVFKGRKGCKLFNFDWWEFARE